MAATIGSERLNGLVESIKQLNPTEYEELFKLLHANKCEYTRNNNGIFLNLSWLDEAMLHRLELFIEFCKASRREIQHYETLCKNLSLAIPTKFGSGAGGVNDKGNHDASEGIDGGEDGAAKKTTGALGGSLPKNTSSMKFYLLKKKFAKNASFETLQSDLEKEAVLL